MRWFRQQGEPKFEECRELVIDFDHRKILFSGWTNHPMGGSGTTHIYAFEDVGSEDFNLFLKFSLVGDPSHVFGKDANEDFDRILKMSKEEYVAQKYDRKEVTIDYVGGNDINETKYTKPYRIVYRNETYEIIYDETATGTSETAEGSQG